ncbi:MAG: peptide/nickel transport system substrate-binding protein [Thermoleophilaceae bacterium]|jgi:peptide/nickel transport system substrate-binding protein|nr:peptide/nickel transport system substrate-binding protein [Thermoleophilaceae bacterium]
MRGLWLVVLLAVALAIAGCGGSGAKKGGTLTVIATDDIQYMDPGAQYYQFDYMVLAQPGQRALYGWKAGGTKPVPDLATSMPQVSDGGRTIKITLRKGVKFSPPVNRAVTSADVKYAIERLFLPQVGNGYALTYMAGLVGNKEYTEGKAKDIKGIETPDPQTLILKLTEPSYPVASANALALPGSAPVPQEYAARYDKGDTSSYAQHVVFTGPYMVRNDKSGKLVGWQPGKQIELVRNPNWDSKTDYRAANIDRILVKLKVNATVASRQILNGKGMVNGDFAAPPTPILKQALDSRKGQLDILPGQSNRYISLNTTIKPLDDVNVRRAIAAVTDRDELRLTRGGPTLGAVANHFIPPGIPGFDEAGGNAGPGFDFTKNPNGDVELAKSYMRKAGFASGMYSGPPLLMVGDNEEPSNRTAEAFQAQLQKIGIGVKLRQVPHATVLSEFCQTPKAKVALCPNLGWAKDFYDAEAFVDLLFAGSAIQPDGGNYNHAEFNDPKINKEIEAARKVTDPAARAKAYGQIDRDVTNLAPVVTWLWDNQVNIRSKDVKGVVNAFNSTYDLSFTSIK